MKIYPNYSQIIFTVRRPLSHNVLFGFLLEVPLTNFVTQYSCSIRPMAGGTCQKCSSKHQD